MKPYKFEPYLKTTLWGGYQIAPFKGIYTAQPNIGESWEISGVPGHESVAIDRGLIDDVDLGLTLTELIDKYKGLLIGNRVYKRFGNKFPLLVKFIDSRQDLRTGSPGRQTRTGTSWMCRKDRDVVHHQE